MAKKEYQIITKYVINRNINIKIDPAWTNIYLGIVPPRKYKEEYTVIQYHIPVVDNPNDLFNHIPKMQWKRFHSENAANRYYNARMREKAKQWKINTDADKHTPFDFLQKQIDFFYNFSR